MGLTMRSLCFLVFFIGFSDRQIYGSLFIYMYSPNITESLADRTPIAVSCQGDDFSPPKLVAAIQVVNDSANTPCDCLLYNYSNETIAGYQIKQANTTVWRNVTLLLQESWNETGYDNGALHIEINSTSVQFYLNGGVQSVGLSVAIETVSRDAIYTRMMCQNRVILPTPPTTQSPTTEPPSTTVHTTVAETTDAPTTETATTQPTPTTELTTITSSTIITATSLPSSNQSSPIMTYTTYVTVLNNSYVSISSEESTTTTSLFDVSTVVTVGTNVTLNGTAGASVSSPASNRTVYIIIGTVCGACLLLFVVIVAAVLVARCCRSSQNPPVHEDNMTYAYMESSSDSSGVVDESKGNTLASISTNDTSTLYRSEYMTVSSVHDFDIST